MRTSLLAITAAAVLAAAAPARASLTASESEQVRRGVATATDLARVRALVARPDLTGDEAAAALASPLAATPLDGAHMAFLNDLVFGDASDPSRPVLAPAALRGVLARADALIAQHPLDLERSQAALGELGAAYGFAEKIAAYKGQGMPTTARADCARALGDHVARNRSVLGPQSRAEAHVRASRAQVAIALLDLMPDAPTRRIDAAEALALTGARRDLLVQRGILALDGAGPDERAMVVLRDTLDRLPGLNDGIEAVVAGAGSGLAARDGQIIAVPDDPAGPSSLWGPDVAGAPADAWATAVARALAAEAVARAVSTRDALRARVERDGGVPAVASLAAMLVLNAPLALDAAVARLHAGRGDSAARLADALGALAALSAVDPAAAPGSAPQLASGRAPSIALNRVVLDAAGGAHSFLLDGHRWSIEREGTGAVSVIMRDGIVARSAH